MKITFLVPPSFDENKPAERTAGCTRLVYDMPNIYALTVAAVFEREGYDVRYEDFVLKRKSREDCKKFIEKDDSEIYVFWSVNLSIATDVEVQKLIHASHPEAYVVFMGPAGTYFPDMLLDGEKSVIVRGEPELTAIELAAAISKGEDWHNIDGLFYYDVENKRVTATKPRPLNKNLDDLPFPAIHFIEDFHFMNPKLKVSPYMSVVASRNCPFHCIYCVPSSLTFAREIEYRSQNPGLKPPVGFRSVENVVAEIESLAAKGYKAIGFMDDNFITTAKRLDAICEPLRKHGIVWGCQARVDAITEEVAQILANSNCKYVDLGIESFNDEILKFIRKGITESKIYEAINLLKKYNVPVKLNILIGTSPIETEETIKDTFRKVKSLKVDAVMFNIVSPFPATEFHDMALKNGWIKGGKYTPTDVQRTSILEYPNLSSKQMEKLLFRNNISFYLSPSFVLRNIVKFRSWKDFVMALKAIKVKLFG